MTGPTAGTEPHTTPLDATTAGALGRIVWYDLMTPDAEGAIAFYTAVTGWTTMPFEVGGGGPPYTMWVNAAGTPIGGVMAMSPDEAAAGAPHWLMYVGTPDIDATYAEALRLGARSYVAPRDIPTVGRFAVLADPQGAAFALFTPETPRETPEPAEPGVGDVAWHELFAADLEPAFEFYARLVGWKKARDFDMGPMGPYRIFGRGGPDYGGMMTRMDAQQPPAWRLYIRVAALDAAVAAVTAHGGQVLNGPMEVPGGARVAQCLDPRGGTFALHELPK